METEKQAAQEPEQAKADAFDGAVFYSHPNEETESLIHERVEDCLESFLDTLAYVEGLESPAEGHYPVEITAWAREAVGSEWAKRKAKAILEGLDEDFSDEYGDPEGIMDCSISKEEWAALELKMIDLISEHATLVGPVWRCKPVATRTFSAEEALEIIGEDTDEDAEKNSAKSAPDSAEAASGR